EIDSDDMLLTLEVEALQSGLLSDFLRLRQQLRAEAYAESGEIHALELEWSEHLNLPPAGFSLSPNPAREMVVVRFESDSEREVLLQLIDMQGKVIFENTFAATKGENHAVLRPNMPLSGLYFVKADGKTAG